MLRGAGYSPEEIQALEESGAAKGADAAQREETVPGMSAADARARDSATRSRQEDEEMLRMGELARASGVSAATIKHYLREGLLPEPVKTSRNMAYYPAEFVDRIKMIKQLQEERYMPLRVIKDLLEEDPDRAKALIELGDRLLEHALAGESERVSATEVRHRYDIPKDVLDRLAELEVLTPDKKGYSPSDVRIVEAISRFRAGGYEERIGFTVYDTLRYKDAMADLVKQEVDVLMERLAGEMDADEAMALIEAGTQPLNDLLAAMHTKALVAELERRRGSEPDSNGKDCRRVARDGGARDLDAGRVRRPGVRWCASRSSCSAPGRTGLIGVRRGAGALGLARARILFIGGMAHGRASSVVVVQRGSLDTDRRGSTSARCTSSGSSWRRPAASPSSLAQLGMGESWRIGVE